jgi:hypothetical protein
VQIVLLILWRAPVALAQQILVAVAVEAVMQLMLRLREAEVRASSLFATRLISHRQQQLQFPVADLHTTLRKISPRLQIQVVFSLSLQMENLFPAAVTSL